MIRRTFLAHGLVLFGFGRRVWAQLTGSSPRYARLTSTVRVPIDKVTTPWHLAPFTAEGVSPPINKAKGRRVLLSGVLFRRSTDADRSELSALCLTCPHEQCRVDLITDAARLATIEGASGRPVFLCGCHDSVFDAVKDGAWLAGPASRGLYRFRITAVDAESVEIAEVEAVALSEV